jgi:hypothetical protein
MQVSSITPSIKLSVSSLDRNIYSCLWIKVVMTHSNRCTFLLECLQDQNIMVKHYSWTTWPQPSKRIATSLTQATIYEYSMWHTHTRSSEVHFCFRFFACKLAVKSRSAAPFNNVLTRWGRQQTQSLQHVLTRNNSASDRTRNINLRLPWMLRMRGNPIHIF